MQGTAIRHPSGTLATLRNTEHRMKHCLQLIAIPKAPSSSSSPELQSLKKRIADLKKARSRSPRRNVQKQASLGAGPAMLTLPAPAPRPQGQKRASRGHRKDGKGKGKSSSTPGGQKNFEYLMKLPVDFRKNFHEKFHEKDIGYRFSEQQLPSHWRNLQVLSYLRWLRWLEALRRLQMPHLQDSLSFIFTVY